MDHHWQHLAQQARIFLRRYCLLAFILLLVALAQIIHFGLVTMSSAQELHVQKEAILPNDNIITEPFITKEPSEPITTDKQEILVTQALAEPQQESQSVSVQNDIGTSQVMYIHLKDNSTNSKCPWVPDVLEYKLSEEDIPVDMSICIDPNLAYSLNDDYRQTVNLLVEREAGTQSFLGKLLVAEGIISRIRSGVYGADISAILINGYLAQKDDNGNLHVLFNSYELTEASNDSIYAVDLALKGSNASGILLKAVTQLRNEQYDLQLDNTYYKWGSIYHFNPDLVSDSQIRVRSLSRVPVSFQFEDHIFYGYWHPESTKLHL